MNTIVALDLLFAIAVVTGLALVCCAAYRVAGGAPGEVPAPVELPRADEMRRAAEPVLASRV
jgi:hypothetical protein